MKKESTIIYKICLIMAAIIWGFAFAFQQTGGKAMPPFYFNGIRLTIAWIVLIPVLLVYNKKNPQEEKKIKNKIQLKAGILCGLVLGIASALQQYGLNYTQAGKSSFITALYIIMVLIFGIFFKRKAGAKVWIAAFIAVVGMYFLCVSGASEINKGDVLTFICAIFFAMQIMIIDKYGNEVNTIMLSMTQFFVAAIISFVCAVFTETVTGSGLHAAIIPLLYTGIMSGAVAYTLQIIGQAKTQPAVASILMSGESVFGAVGGFLILGQVLTIKELIGCALMFGATILAQLPDKTNLKQ